MSKYIGKDIVFTSELYSLFKKSHSEVKIDKKTFTLIHKEILKEIRSSILNSQGGVYIKKFGYFSLFRSSVRRSMKTIRGKICWNSHTNGYKFMPIFTPCPKADALVKYWSMDRRFSVTLNKELIQKVKDGFRYKNHIYSLQLKKDLND